VGGRGRGASSPVGGGARTAPGSGKPALAVVAALPALGAGAGLPSRRLAVPRSWWATGRTEGPRGCARPSVAPVAFPSVVGDIPGASGGGSEAPEGGRGVGARAADGRCRRPGRGLVAVGYFAQEDTVPMPDVRPQPPQPSPPAPPGVIVDDDQPLIAVPLDEDGRRRVAYYTSDADADAALPDAAVRRALDLAGAWADLDWEEAVAELDRIRHQTPPTPPVDAQLDALLGDSTDAGDRER
jgi:hypothetical protein